MQPKVSVIIPVYNVEQYLKHCLDSALAQTLSPIEIICVDDGSTDASPDILAQYAASNPCLRVDHQQNSGSSVARNRALDLASGEYVLFLDSDDWLIGPDVLEILYARATELDVDELYFNATGTFERPDIYANPDGLSKTYHFCGQYSANLVLDGLSMLAVLSDSNDFRPYIWRRLYRRALIEKYHLRFQPGIIHQDHIFALEFTSLAKRVSCFDFCAYNRNMRANSITTEANHVFKSVYARYLGKRILYDFAKEHFNSSSRVSLDYYYEDIDHWMKRSAIAYLRLDFRQIRHLWHWLPARYRLQILWSLETHPHVRKERARRLHSFIKRQTPKWALTFARKLRPKRKD